MTENEFKKSVIEEIQTKKRPWYAFNKEFEEKFLQISVDNELQQKERESAFGALLEEGLLDNYNLLCDPLFNEEIPNFGTLGTQLKIRFLSQKLSDIISAKEFRKILVDMGLALEETQESEETRADKRNG